MGYHGFKEIGKRPSEEPGRWRCAIWGTTSEVMQDRPYLVPLLWQPPLIVMELRQRTVAAFHCRGGSLKGEDLLRGQRVPSLQRLRRQLLGEGMPVQCGVRGFPDALHRRFPPRTARMRAVMPPIDTW